MMKRIFTVSWKYIVLPLLSVVVLVSVFYVVLNLVTSPSNDRTWNEDQTVLPYATVDGDIVTVYNIRNFDYDSTTSYTPHYYNKTFDLSTIKNVWYVVEPFEGVPGSAHTFLSFEFEGDVFIAVSVEIRKEQGESFHPLKGMINHYELMYVFADEADVIKLRTNYRHNLVYLYKTTARKEKSRELFLDMVDRANSLYTTPEFYNTIINNCTTNIVRHINAVSHDRVPVFSLRYALPLYSVSLAQKRGLLDTSMTLEELQAKSLINNKALMYGNDPQFSLRIRDR